MQVYQASAAKNDGSFLHVGYGSASRQFRDSISNDVKASYTEFSRGIREVEWALRREEVSPEQVEWNRHHPSLTEHSWQAPEGTAALFRQNILVSTALELEGYPALAGKGGTDSTKEHLAAFGIVVPDPPVPKSSRDLASYFVADMFIGILVFLGILLLIRSKPARSLKPAGALATWGLVLSLAVPVTYAVARDQISSYPERANIKAAQISAQAEALQQTEAIVTDWKMEGVKLKYKYPEQATMVLMHGVIGHAIFLMNKPVYNLTELEGFVRIPGKNKGDNGIYYAQACYGLDGWGNEFRITNVLQRWDTMTALIPTEWLVTLQSAGEDGEFDSDDDYILTSKQNLRFDNSYEYFSYNDPPEDIHYSAYIQAQGTSKVMYLPALSEEDDSYKGQGKFNKVLLKKGHEHFHEARDIILAETDKLNSKQLVLQIYCHPILDQLGVVADG